MFQTPVMAHSTAPRTRHHEKASSLLLVPVDNRVAARVSFAVQFEGLETEPQGARSFVLDISSKSKIIPGQSASGWRNNN